jgi:hypothetical protein
MRDIAGIGHDRNMTAPWETIEVGGVRAAVLAAAGVERLGAHKLTVSITPLRNQFGTFTMLTALLAAIGAVAALITGNGCPAARRSGSGRSP